jgi:hypothetical protein
LSTPTTIFKMAAACSACSSLGLQLARPAAGSASFTPTFTWQEWDLEHPDYLVPKPGYPSDVAVKVGLQS